ncbi:uncharacterized protein LOC143223502 [Tachypleus tridentatus]|uniref:uncharacterized protein LOC143223502 n=1 Tax=Tachypleus tridentatus TaxID=6853 RepID=UPI003FD2B522
MSQDDQWKWIITAILLVVGLLSDSSGTQVKGGIGGGNWQGDDGSWKGGGGGGSWQSDDGSWQGGGGGGSWQGGGDHYPTNDAGVLADEIRTIPKTSFKCSNQPYVPGYYADVETQCKVYHICHKGRMESMYCAPGTVFNQEILACDFEGTVDCEAAPNFYYKNEELGKIPDSRPYQPSYPSQPSFPSPSKPRQPSYPSQPSFPSPSKPRQPSYPSQPSFPSPSKPRQPSYPSQPSFPSPSKPRQPSYPSQPSFPSPSKPRQPSYPSQPSFPSPSKPHQPSFPHSTGQQPIGIGHPGQRPYQPPGMMMMGPGD